MATFQPVLRLRRAFTPGIALNWEEARAAILAGAPIDTTISNHVTPYGETPLICASRSHRIEEVRWLLDQGANPNFNEGVGWTALTAAVANGHTDAICLLLARRADPNAFDGSGWTALMFVHWYPYPGSDPSAVLATLLDHGADPSQKAPDGCTLPEIFVSTHRKDMLPILDRALAGPQRAEARQRLLARLTADRRAAWLPKSSAVEAGIETTTRWRRRT